MSTRATIIVKNSNEKYHLYHHCDGYPEGIGKDLKNYLKTVSHWYPDDITNVLIKGGLNNDDGYEITSGQHGDEEYGYLIDCDKKRIKCYRLAWDEFDWKESKVVEIPD